MHVLQLGICMHVNGSSLHPSFQDVVFLGFRDISVFVKNMLVGSTLTGGLLVMKELDLAVLVIIVAGL